MAESLLFGSVNQGTYSKNIASQEATKTNTNTNSSLGEASSGTAYDKEMFLQLLTAEMQYQDPLEPTSNSEYVAELASFTQIEAIQSVQSEMESIQANSLVGRYVVLKDEDHNEVAGKVDFVTTDDEGNMKLSVNEKLYDVDSLQSVVDEEYYEAAIITGTFSDEVSKLPELGDVSLADEEQIGAVRAFYNSLVPDVQKFVSSSDLEKLEQLEKRLAALKEE